MAKQKTGAEIHDAEIETVEAKTDEQVKQEAVEACETLPDDFDFSRLPQRSKYTEADMITAAAYYVILGSSVKTEKYSGIPSRTIRQWMASDWWTDLTHGIRRKKQDELDAKLTGLMESAVDGLAKRLIQGDEVLQQGQLHQVPLSALTVAKILGICYDKRALLRGDPTSRTAAVESTDQILSKLQDKLEKMAENMLPRPIEGEVVKDAEQQSETEQPTTH